MNFSLQRHSQLWMVGGIVTLFLVVSSMQPPLTLFLLLPIALAVAVSSPLSVWMLALVLAPLRVLIQTESPLRLPLDIGQISLAAFAASWLGYAILTKRAFIPLRWTRLALPLATFVAASVLSLFFAASLSVTLIEIVKWLTILVMALLTFHLARFGHWRLILFTLVLSGVASSLIGIYTFLGGSGALHLLIQDRFFRAFGTFGQPNPFGGFMGLLLPLALVGVVISFPRKIQFPSLLFTFYATASILIGAGLLMSWSRGAWIGTIVAILVMVFAVPRSRFRSITASLVIGSLFLSSALFGLIPTSILDRISSSTAEFFAFEDMRGVDISNENYAVVERLAHWQAALNIATDNSNGVGLGNYETVYSRYRLLNWKFPLGHAHNYYLNVLAETGMIGLTAYLFFILGTFVTSWWGRAHPSNNLRWLVIGLLGSLTYLGFHSLLDNLYVNNVFIHIGTIIGLIYYVCTDARRTISVE
jgi:putative inorganic carbon (hco3(-)) transporter